MANLITLSRLLLLLLVAWIAYQPPSAWQLLNVPLMILIFVTDGLDGYVARKRNETTLFGALFDIAGDRIVELTMWIVLADLDLVPVWVPLVFIIRGTVVDTIRSSQSANEGETPFGMMRSPLGRWLVAGRFMRAFYAVIKAVAFCWLLLILPLPAVVPALWSEWGWLLTAIGAGAVWLAVVLCIARGLPVVVEFVHARRHELLPDTGGQGDA
jgi:CDP-diacylglycerol--glycerol-3-phosphate 3-phosphatidyltransferase